MASSLAQGTQLQNEGILVPPQGLANGAAIDVDGYADETKQVRESLLTVDQTVVRQTPLGRSLLQQQLQDGAVSGDDRFHE